MTPIQRGRGIPGLRATRKAYGLTQHQLEGLIGASGGAVQRWEDGDRDPSVWAALALADALDTTVEALCNVEARMVEAMVMVQHNGKDHWEGMGSRKFAVMPRVGEFIDFDIDGIGVSYRVVMVSHPLDPATTAGDIHAVYEGKIVDLLQAALRKVA